MMRSDSGALGVKGSQQDLVPIFRSVEGHPLLVQALASEVANYRKAPADFARWRIDHPEFNPTTLPLVQSRTHILEFALAGLNADVLEVLRTLVAFRMPATYDTLEALLVGPGKTYGSAQGLDRALSELEDRGLIGWDREANRYDAHPIVRGVVWQQTSSKDQEAVYTALEAHFEPMATPEWSSVESLEDLTPAIERYHTLVGLGRYDDALRLFRDRLSRATLYRLAAHRERIAWLERLFPGGLEGLPALTDEDQVYMLNTLAASYTFSGQPGRAMPLLRRLNETLRKRQDKSIQASLLENIAITLRETGVLRDAAGNGRQALELAREMKSEFDEATSLAEIGRALGTMGDHELAHAALARSLQIFAKLGVPQWEGLCSAYLGEQWLWLGDFPKARACANRAWKLAGDQRLARDFIRAALRQGQSALGLGEVEGGR
jgi:tetratricopeptide (TPR) repeat protein